jgi:hypothetical protein
MAAHVIFADLARDTSSDEPLDFGSVDPASHVFKDDQCARQVEQLLVLRGLADAPKVAAEADADSDEGKKIKTRKNPEIQ